MPNTQSSKGNPASKRMSNAHLKDARARRWRAGQTRKLTRSQTQRASESANAFMRRLPASDLAGMVTAREAGKTLAVIAKDYGTNEFTVARLVRYGKLTPWQVSEANRALARRGKKEEWEKRQRKS